jgi:REP element-mobilizing transposase RayT
MVIGHHLVWTAYGCWLPNDPRGSSSHELRVVALEPLGELHEGRKKIQPHAAEIRAFYRRADEILAHERRLLTDDEVALIADGFRRTIRERRYTCYACAIMPDHVHLLIRRHRERAEEMLEYFQQASKEALHAAGRRPRDHPVWGGPGWKKFLSTRQALEDVIEYIRRNPLKAGRPEQRWDFVTQYDGWLPAPARRMQ